jgi:hypothetical protein
MNNNLEAALQSLIGHEVFVHLQLTDGGTGRSGRLTTVGVDYLVINDGTRSYIIPFNAIALIQPQ